MKKEEYLFFVIFCFILAVSLLFFTSAQSLSTEINKSVFDEGAGTILNATEKLKNLTEDSDFLGEQWKKFLLKNEFIYSLDKLFKEFNFLFIILFGQNYEFSLTLFFTILLWIIFLIIFANIFSVYMAFSNKGISFAIAIAFNIIVAQLGIFNFISKTIVNLIFLKEGIWILISFFILIFALIFFFVLGLLIVKNMRKRMKLKAEFKQKLNQKVLGTTVEGILKEYGGK